MNICQRVLRNSREILRFHRTGMLYPYSVRNVGAYEGHGKTTFDILNKKDTDFHLISAYSRMGFRLNNDTFVVGPMLIHENTVLCWNINGDKYINEDSLEFFFHLAPPLDLLIIGFGDEKNLKEVDKEVMRNIRKHNIQIEILTSTKAVQMYNFIAGTRNVAAALVPPRYYKLFHDDMLSTKSRYGVSEGLPIDDNDADFLVKEARKLGIKT